MFKQFLFGILSIWPQLLRLRFDTFNKYLLSNFRCLISKTKCDIKTSVVNKSFSRFFYLNKTCRSNKKCGFSLGCWSEMAEAVILMLQINSADYRSVCIKSRILSMRAYRYPRYAFETYNKMKIYNILRNLAKQFFIVNFIVTM